jgi:hypothetical protein
MLNVPLIETGMAVNGAWFCVDEVMYGVTVVGRDDAFCSETETVSLHRASRRGLQHVAGVLAGSTG